MFLSKSAGRGVASAGTESTIPGAGPGPESHAHGPSGNLRGILAMLAAMFFFITNDMFVKLASESLGIAQVIFIRGSMAVVLVAALAWWAGALRVWPRRGWRAIALRSFGEVFATILYLTALFHMQIANATAILQAMPLVMTVISALALGEVVRWRRWLAVSGGFIGMLMVVQPGTAGFDSYALFAVASLAFAALRDLSSRYLPAEVPSFFVALVSMITVTAFGGLWSIGEPWAPMSGEVLAYLACAAALLSGAFYFITEAMRHGEVSLVAPFRYSIIVAAIVLGYLVWGEIPDALALAGIALIVFSGLYVFYREGRTRGGHAHAPTRQETTEPR